MKRFTALVLTIVIGISTVFGMTGCTAVQADGALTMGQWLALVIDAFGMQTYTEETPYFEKVPSSDDNFELFQMAAEWDIVEPSAEIDSSTPLKWNDVLITLVNAGGFVNEDATDQEKIDYAINNIDTSIRDYWGERYVKLSEAVPVLDKAKDLWANRKYTEKIEKVSYNEDVKDFSSAEDIDFEIDGDVVRTSETELADLQEGDVYTLPATETEPVTLKRVESIQRDGDEVVITNEDETEFSGEEMMEQLEDLQIQSTETIDFTNISAVYDEEGNLVYSPENQAEIENSVADRGEYEIRPLGKLSSDYENENNITLENVSFTVENNGYEISVSVKKNELKFEIAKTLSKSSNQYAKTEKKVYASAAIKDLDLTTKIDYSFLKGLNEARAVLDYKTTIEGGVSGKTQADPSKALASGIVDANGLQDVIKKYKDKLNTLTKKITGKDNSDNFTDSIYIGKFNIGGVSNFANVSLIVKATFSVSGELKLVFNMEGEVGAYYEGGNFGTVNNTDRDTEFAAEGKEEITLAAGVGIYVFGDINVIEILGHVGAGFQLSAIPTLVDSEMHKLSELSDSKLSPDIAATVSQNKTTVSSEDILAKAESEGGTWKNYTPGQQVEVTCLICLDWKVYPIVKIGIDNSSLVAKLIPNKELEVELLNENNAAFLKGHIDFPNENDFENLFADGVSISDAAALLGVNQSCSFKFKPWDETEDEEVEADAQDQEIKVTSTIQLSSVRLFMEKEQEATVEIVGLPKGYKLEDVTAEVDDESIATFDLDTFTVKAKDKPGTTQIVIQTKDGEHKAYCAVTINEDFSVDFEGLPEM